jgi:hypothetical protein
MESPEATKPMQRSDFTSDANVGAPPRNYSAVPFVQPPTPSDVSPESHTTTPPLVAAKNNLESELRALHDSGPANGKWAMRTSNLLNTLKGSPQLAGRADTATVECFARGCSLAMRTHDLATAWSIRRDIEASEEWHTRNGPYFRAGPHEFSEGHFDTVFILFSPANQD